MNVNRVQRLGRQEMTYDHISNAQGRLKIMAIGSRPKTLLDFLYRYSDCLSVTSVHPSGRTVHSLHLQGLLLACYDCDELGAGQSQCFLY
jgi:hypothetical protein